MKTRLFAQAVSVSAIALLQTATIIQPSYAEGNTFFCGTSNDVPATLVQTSRGEVPMIRWVSNDFSSGNYTPMRRCQDVSAKFQRFSDNGTLKFIRTGIVNRYPVLCIASYQGGECKDNAVILTLQTGSDSQLVLERLLNLRARAAGKPIELSSRSRSLIFYYEGEAYVNLKQLLQEIELDTSVLPKLPTSKSIELLVNFNQFQKT